MTYDRSLIAEMLRNPFGFRKNAIEAQADLLEAADNACDVQTVSDRLAKLKELSEMADAAEQTFAVKWMRANTINIQSSELAPVEFQAACVAYVRDQFAGVN